VFVPFLGKVGDGLMLACEKRPGCESAIPEMKSVKYVDIEV
jgi:hypothetical protein